MALSPSREPAVWAGVGMTCGFIQQVFNNLLLVTSVSSGSASSHANFWEPTLWKVKNKREWVTPVREILSFQLSLNFGWDVFAWEGCWLSTKVGRSKKVGYEERSVPVCLMSSWRQLLQHQSCVTTPFHPTHTRTCSHTTIRCVLEIWGRGERRHDTKSEMTPNFISDFSLFYIAIYFYLCVCLCICVSSRYMYAENHRGQKAVSDRRGNRVTRLRGQWGLDRAAGTWMWVLRTECGHRELNSEPLKSSKCS